MCHPLHCTIYKEVLSCPDNIYKIFTKVYLCSQKSQRQFDLNLIWSFKHLRTKIKSNQVRNEFKWMLTRFSHQRKCANYMLINFYTWRIIRSRLAEWRTGAKNVRCKKSLLKPVVSHFLSRLEAHKNHEKVHVSYGQQNCFLTASNLFLSFSEFHLLLSSFGK